MKRTFSIAIVGIALIAITPHLNSASIHFGRTRTRVSIAQGPPFTQCPAVGQDTSCAILLVIDADGSLRVRTDSSQGPFDGIEDTLIGVQNNSNTTVFSIPLSSTIDLFGFDGDGLCSASPHPSGCPFGPTGYEGPGVSFTNISADRTSGVVNFAGGIPPGGSAYFSLEERIETVCQPIMGVGNLKQFSSPWATDTYDHDTATDQNGKPNNIKRWGCYLTACVNVINYQAGHQGIAFSTTPRDLNTWLNGERDGYSGDNVNPPAVARYARQNHVQLFYQGRVDSRNDFVLDSYLCSNNPVLLKVPRAHGTHFVAASGQTTINGTDTYSISDPGHNDTANPQFSTLEGYGFTYLGIRKFSSTATPPNGLYVAGHSPIELIVTDPNGRRTGFNSANGQIITEIPGSGYATESLGDDIDTASSDTTPEVKLFEILSPLSGTYTVKVMGTGLGAYSLDFLGYDNNGSPSTFTLSGNAAPGSVTTYQIVYSGTSGVNLPFDFCVQDESNGKIIQLNSTTGAYLFTKCGAGGVSLSGTGTVVIKGSVVTLQHNTSDRRVLARIDNSVNRGTASVQVFPPGTTFTIADRNTTNNSCSCQ